MLDFWSNFLGSEHLDMRLIAKAIMQSRFYFERIIIRVRI